MIVLPLLIIVAGGLALLFARAVLRIELQTLSQELKVCYASTHPHQRCRARFKDSIHKLPGQFRWVGAQNFGDEFQVVVRHQLPLPPRTWTFAVPR